MSGPLEFRLSRDKADFFPATLEMMRRTRVPVIALLIFIVILASLYMGLTFRHSPMQGWIAMGTFIGVALYSAAIWLLVCYFVARRGYSAPGALEPTHYIFSEDGIWGEAGNIKSETRWDFWKSVFSTARFMIIASHGGQWIFFPRRALDGETFARLEALAHAKLSAPKPKARRSS
jgi:amino acid transporter